jgi:excisionase family DNA binding protein
VVDSKTDDKNCWLSLGDACRILDVSQSTLRQWADGGYLKVYRTPGGHRRFLRDDLAIFVDGSVPQPHIDSHMAMEGSALRRIRRRLHQEAVLRQPWYQSLDSEGRDRMRLFGRRLLSLLAQQPLQRPRRQEAISEAFLLGRQYGAEMVEKGVALKDTVEAFVFFRTMVLESAPSDSWSWILELADRVLVGVTESHEQRMTSINGPDGDPGLRQPNGVVTPK